MVNLVALCQPHHRLHHRGRLGIEGNADEVGGVVFTDERGRRLDAAGRPHPPGDRRPPPGNWMAPPNEPLDSSVVYFNEASTG